VEHLKDLCAVSSRYPSRRVSEQRLMQELVTESSCSAEKKNKESAPYFSISQENKENKSFVKNKIKMMENMEKMQEISF
jgi:hypothetical protein